mmetsp:Transcript_2287/g.2558  ORF Transcript_2287/g.2558 Transcript_2287/m.2558 type:complete len:236 (+) Transcript_2287:359-1066(+)
MWTLLGFWSSLYKHVWVFPSAKVKTNSLTVSVVWSITTSAIPKLVVIVVISHRLTVGTDGNNNLPLSVHKSNRSIVRIRLTITTVIGRPERAYHTFVVFEDARLVKFCGTRRLAKIGIFRYLIPSRCNHIYSAAIRSNVASTDYDGRDFRSCNTRKVLTLDIVQLTTITMTFRLNFDHQRSERPEISNGNSIVTIFHATERRYRTTTWIRMSSPMRASDASPSHNIGFETTNCTL